MVECLQNLYHHIDEFEIVGSPEELAEKKSAIFSISRTPESYDIVTGNYIDQANVKDISQKIEYINSLNKDELKAYYKEVLNNGVLSKKGGGGLGLIDIAQMSYEKHPLDTAKELKLLTMPSEMGSLCKVLGLTKNVSQPELAGFYNYNKVESLF